jgi:hypothetical protein
MPAPQRGGRRTGTELFKDVGAVRGERGFDDVVLLGDLLAAVPELSGGVVGVGFLVNDSVDLAGHQLPTANRERTTVR